MAADDYEVFRFDDVGWLTEIDMIEVDRVMIEDLGITLIQMMENAGRSLAQLVLDLYRPGSVTVLAGAGGNGGGGLVAARHLANRGVDVSVTLSKSVDDFSGVPAVQADILQRMGIEFVEDPRSSDVIVDALIGYSLHGSPRGKVAGLVTFANEAGGSVVSLDTPSGLDVTDGSTPGAVASADVTMTLALPKTGLRESSHVGDLYVADISVPRSVYDTIGVGPPPSFSSGTIFRLRSDQDASL